jgi:hypothetical protein
LGQHDKLGRLRGLCQSSGRLFRVTRDRQACRFAQQIDGTAQLCMFCVAHHQHGWIMW